MLSAITPRPSLENLMKAAGSLEHFGDLGVFRTSGEAEEDIFQAALALADAAQLIHRSGGDQASLVDDADAIAHAFGDFEDVGRKEHRRAAVSQLAQDVLDQARRLRVESDRRLLEHQHLLVG